MILRRIYTGFINALFPKKRRCLLCGKENYNRLCSLCSSSLEFIHDRRCLKCGKGLDDDYKEMLCPDCIEKSYSFHTAYSSFYYKGGGKELIHKLKYEGEKDAAKILAKYMARTVMEEKLKGDIIAPVPIHDSKLDIRGFNQSFLIGEYLSRYISLPLWDCLIRTKKTKDQYNLDKIQRKLNVNGAFSINLLYNVINKRVLLIDDIYTTGSTVEECSKVLLKAGASRVYVVTAASGTNT